MQVEQALDLGLLDRPFEFAGVQGRGEVEEGAGWGRAGDAFVLAAVFGPKHLAEVNHDSRPWPNRAGYGDVGARAAV